MCECSLCVSIHTNMQPWNIILLTPNAALIFVGIDELNLVVWLGTPTHRHVL